MNVFHVCTSCMLDELVCPYKENVWNYVMRKHKIFVTCYVYNVQHIPGSHQFLECNCTFFYEEKFIHIVSPDKLKISKISDVLPETLFLELK